MKVLSIYKRLLWQETRDRLVTLLLLLTTPFFILFFWSVFGKVKAIQIRIHWEGGADWETSPWMQRAKAKLVDSDTTLCSSETECPSPDLKLYIQSQTSDAKLKVILKTNPHSNISQDSLQTIVMLLQSELLHESQVKFQLETEEVVSKRQKDSQFQQFVPGFLVFSIIMVLFSTAMSVTQERESGNWVRMYLSSTNPIYFHMAQILLQLTNAIFSLSLSLSLAVTLGFHTETPVLFLFIGVLGALPFIGLGICLSAFLETSLQAFLSASFFMFLFLLISGILFPRPTLYFFSLELFSYFPGALLKSIWESGLEEQNFGMKFIVLMAEGICLLGLGGLLFQIQSKQSWNKQENI
ncbi:hypothetical protein LPTSP4_11790 [Leptospira ryugenii]|uniref:ABC-2 type transporter transmembrane domain-containing protein n=1 Tax=Leptospira ryugenii TaxID=1917863 RepID=A0A2P2DYF8_9LEPT|nr:ABC transporter permease [Leptospira ryugenii]GBF49663.1 hypothetical protein LPTSP4_11790 [Leptospira ryugenii]